MPGNWHTAPQRILVARPQRAHADTASHPRAGDQPTVLIVWPGPLGRTAPATGPRHMPGGRPLGFAWLLFFLQAGSMTHRQARDILSTRGLFGGDVFHEQNAYPLLV